MTEMKTCVKDPFDNVTDHSESVCEFLKKLDKSNDRWQQLGGWIFRGQKETAWEPMPSLFRNAYDHTPPQFEIALIDDFIRHINFVNLPIPSNGLDYLRFTSNGTMPTLRTGKSLKYEFTYDFTHVAFAIAQHSGVPTRLLDFSYNPLVAAHFAAENSNVRDVPDMPREEKASCFDDLVNTFKSCPSKAMRALGDLVNSRGHKTEESSRDVAVWAVPAAYTNYVTSLRVLDHPFSEILNLRSQAGVFLCDTFNEVENDVSHLERRKLARKSFRAQLLLLAKYEMLYKLTLPKSERGELLEILRRRDVDAMHLTPSHATVGETVLRKVLEIHTNKAE